MRRPRTVEITAEAMTASLVVNGLDISDMVHAVDIHIDADSFPTVTIHSTPDVLSFKGTALVDDPRLDGRDWMASDPVFDVIAKHLGAGIARHEVDGIERLRRRARRRADAWGLTPKQFSEALARIKAVMDG